MRKRHARREQQRRNLRPVERAQVRGLDAGGGRLGERRRTVVERNDIRASGLERLRAGKTRAAKAEQGNGFPGKAGGENHRSLSVPSPASASTIEMIQNRITICDSVQPFCSK